MNLLGAKLYDPTTAVNKVTTAALAMTAIDTTNLRLAITVPAHGLVRFRLAAVLHGATTFPSILLGVLNGAFIVGRVAPAQNLGNTAVATALVKVEADFIATGLTPGAMNCDAAYGVETLVAATGLKYGGPNNATANDAFGAFCFEAWDPQSQTANSTLAVDASGRVDVGKWLGTAVTAATAGIPDTNVKNMNNVSASAITTIKAVQGLAVDGVITTLTNLPAITANWLTAAGINAAALNGKGDWNLGKNGYSLTQTFPINFSAMSLTAGGLVTLTVAYDAAKTAATQASVNAIPITAPDNAGIATAVAQTAGLTFTKAGEVDVNLQSVNDVTIVGTGAPGDLFRV